MSNQTIPTRPVNDAEKKLREKFSESIAAQSDLMDKLAERLLTLELAVPGVYATVLKLISGDKATVKIDTTLYLTFGFWLFSLILTLLALTPRKWKVAPSILKQDPKKLSEGLGIEDFFERSALYKRRLIILSSILFFCGIFSSLFTMG